MTAIRLQRDTQPTSAFHRRGLSAQTTLLWLLAMGLVAAGSLAQAQENIVVAQNDSTSAPATDSVSDQPADTGKDEFESLLNLAEQDVSQLTQVKVSERVPSLNTEVTTVSRTPSTVGKSPAAVFVITNDMIRRSGATNLPDVLRMAPGVNVAKIDANTWSVTIRGFSGAFANKLLVQIDGRTVYSPLFGGVFWAAQDVLLEDVERIEVIRGPGATVWGANAVNGIINVITKKAGDTQGTYAQVGAGTTERGFVSARYGGQIGTDIDYRIYGKWFERGPGVPFSGAEFDDWRSARGGFRMDWDPGRCGTDRFTLQGDYYDTPTGTRNIAAITTPPFARTFDTDETFRGSNVLGRWTHVIDDERDWQLQAYYDFTQYNTGDGLFVRENRDTIDVDFQYRLPLGERQKIVWGTAYRATFDHIAFPSFPVSFTTPHQVIHMGSYFLQDEITLAPDRWTATLGCKFLHNSYTNFEYQPTARLLYTPDERQSAWAAVSRAVRLPSRADETVIFNTPPPFPAPVFPQFRGNTGLVSEELLAWECGYRTQPSDYFSWDLALFFNQYNNLLHGAIGVPEFAPFGLVIPVTNGNSQRAQSYGFELAGNLEVTECWKLRTAYSFICVDLLGPDEGDPEGVTSRNQLYVQSSHTLAEGVELDLIGRYADSLPFFNTPSYFVGDVRLAWHYNPCTELFLVGRGLFDNGHHEFGSSPISTDSGVRSEVYAGVSVWR
jgi:iron complex outermembrane receptor protein